MGQPLVSTIIPCYKQAHYVAQAVDSVLNQTYPNVEVIVVDDGSPDNLDEVMAAYASEPRVRVIKQQNSGLSNARNHGVAEARGAYLQFLDSDDWLHPDKFAIQVPLLEAQPEIGFVYSDFYMVYNETEISDEWLVSRSLGSLEPDIFNTLWLNNCVANMTVLIRREWFDKSGGFDPRPILTEDYELWMRLTAMGCKVRYLPQRMGYYRQHKTSMSKDGLQAEREAAAREVIAQRFPELIGPATTYAIATMNASWQKWVDELQAKIKQQDALIMQLQRGAYHPKTMLISFARLGRRIGARRWRQLKRLRYR